MKTELLKIVTRAHMNEEFRMLRIHSQQIFLKDKLICSLPPRTTNLINALTTDQLLVATNENIGSILSQKLLHQLLQERKIKELLLALK